MKYNKLVRDKIPDIIKKDNKNAKIHIASDKEYEEMLIDKLLEEVKEFKEDPNKEELADILEVIESICKIKDFDKSEIDNIRRRKAEQRGSFNKRIILEEVED